MQITMILARSQTVKRQKSKILGDGYLYGLLCDMIFERLT